MDATTASRNKHVSEATLARGVAFACAGASLLWRGVRVVSIYKGHTLALATRDHFNARFYLFNNRYTVFITKILFIVCFFYLLFNL